MTSNFGMKLFSGTAHHALAVDIATCLDCPLADVSVTAFPDGETFVKINENIRGEDVYIIQPTCPPTNHNLMELMIMVDAAKRASAGRINAVIPFFGYARQDRKDQPRVPITAKLVADLLSAAGVDRVVTLDLHAAQIQGFFNIPVDHLYGKPIVIRELRARFGDNCENLTVVSPDVGGVKMARAYSDALGARLAIVAKHRVSATEVEAMQVIGDVEGRDVVLVDDMTETAGTLCAAADILKAQGAKRIFAAVTHAVIGELGHQRIEESAIEEVITTDSTPVTKQGKVTPVSIADLFSEAIQRIHNGKSVTSLFDIDAPSV
ncbi:ribose-phosphate pyrophosphokinase [Akkermansiaceae bacterium]|jgi:ribose-phosphate pyrophosphokinase|nr:ribose-phosphate pyrophosphokinase [Akkermansiaceae bacterium]MDA7513796.1 ribose-phosphate pyrophosphokinase [bacterium]MDA7508793.1 ribose-phosphate pyrophosphokinase [Akkermansiaceae bacterium]MDA7527063.1 ribose-phosphate pyrophosphokinase [Akkermansiaceae bacterium]MDA7539267.1 ribose-phosphate pyrophosphokinase [Akkermansiaceae bacterium]